MSEGQYKEVGKPGQLQRIAEDWIVAEAAFNCLLMTTAGCEIRCSGWRLLDDLIRACQQPVQPR